MKAEGQEAEDLRERFEEREKKKKRKVDIWEMLLESSLLIPKRLRVELRQENKFLMVKIWTCS